MKYILNNQLFGGRGANSPAWETGSDGKDGNGPDRSTRDFVSRINNMKNGNRMSQDYMVEHFRQTFGADNHEHLITVNDDGFATALVHGNEGSVSYNGVNTKGQLVIHNHPNNGAFSRTDLRGLEKSGITGIVAVGESTTYEFRVGKNFKYKEFDKALTKSPVTDTYSRKNGETNQQALNRVSQWTRQWLTKNQKKYGYTFKAGINTKTTFTSNVHSRESKKK